MIKVLCTKFCQAKKGGIINCHAGNVYIFNDNDSYPANCFRVLEKTGTAPAAAPAPKRRRKERG